MPTVLVLDANPDAPMQVRRLLGKLNTIIFEASHLEFALELMRRGSITAIVIGERLLGQHTPFDVVRILRERHPHVRLVFRGSAGSQDLLPAALAAGADEALLDTDDDALVDAIGKSLRAA